MIIIVLDLNFKLNQHIKKIIETENYDMILQHVQWTI